MMWVGVAMNPISIFLFWLMITKLPPLIALPAKNGLSPQLFLCLSRAYLGKTIVFKYINGSKGAFFAPAGAMISPVDSAIPPQPSPVLPV